jgi:hypothetical protein
MMLRKIGSAAVYAITAWDLLSFLRRVYGLGPTIHYSVLIYIAIVGSSLFVIASVFSLFRPRWGSVCALVACILSWPFFSRELSVIPSMWRGHVSVSNPSYWGFRLISIYMLGIASIYSAIDLRLSLRAPDARVR